MKNNKVYGYVRVSTDQQDSSVELQTKRIEEYCLFKSLDLVEIFADEGVSGSIPIDKRIEGGKLCSLLTKEVKGVICVKPDRLFRNTVDAITSVTEWNKIGIELHVIDLGGATLATNTASGLMIFTVLIAFSQFERDITGERTKAILNNKKSEGKVYAGSVLGYDKVGGTLINGKMVGQTLVKNESEQEIIKRIMTLKGSLPPRQIAMMLNDEGFRTKTNKEFLPSTIQSIIKNPIHKNDEKI